MTLLENPPNFDISQQKNSLSTSGRLTSRALGIQNSFEETTCWNCPSFLYLTPSLLTSPLPSPNLLNRMLRAYLRFFARIRGFYWSSSSSNNLQISVNEAKLQWNNVCLIHRHLHRSLSPKRFVTNNNSPEDYRWSQCYDLVAHSISHFVHDELNFLLK